MTSDRYAALTCPTCGRPLPPDADRCAGCGKTLATGPDGNTPDHTPPWPLDPETLRRRVTAHHEAGHAVAAAMYGLPIVKASVVEGGFVYANLELPVPVSDKLVVALAGEAAERLYTNDPLPCIAESDRKRARAIAEDAIAKGVTHGSIDQSLNLARLKAESFALEHWPEITSVAKALCEEGTLSGSRIQRLIRHPTAVPIDREREAKAIRRETNARIAKRISEGENLMRAIQDMAQRENEREEAFERRLQDIRQKGADACAQARRDVIAKYCRIWGEAGFNGIEVADELRKGDKAPQPLPRGLKLLGPEP